MREAGSRRKIKRIGLRRREVEGEGLERKSNREKDGEQERVSTYG